MPIQFPLHQYVLHTYINTYWEVCGFFTILQPLIILPYYCMWIASSDSQINYRYSLREAWSGRSRHFHLGWLKHGMEACREGGTRCHLKLINIVVWIMPKIIILISLNEMCYNWHFLHGEIGVGSLFCWGGRCHPLPPLSSASAARYWSEVKLMGCCEAWGLWWRDKLHLLPYFSTSW